MEQRMRPYGGRIFFFNLGKVMLSARELFLLYSCPSVEESLTREQRAISVSVFSFSS